MILNKTDIPYNTDAVTSIHFSANFTHSYWIEVYTAKDVLAKPVLSSFDMDFKNNASIEDLASVEVNYLGFTSGLSPQGGTWSITNPSLDTDMFNVPASCGNNVLYCNSDDASFMSLGEDSWDDYSFEITAGKIAEDNDEIRLYVPFTGSPESGSETYIIDNLSDSTIDDWFKNNGFTPFPGYAEYLRIRVEFQEDEIRFYLSPVNTDVIDKNNIVTGVGQTLEIIAIDGSGNKSAGVDITATTLDLGVSASDNELVHAVRLAWGSIPGGFTVSYDIYRSTSESGTFSVIDSTINTGYVDTSALPGTVYYYKIKKTNGSTGESYFTNIDSGSALAISAPQNVEATGYAFGGIKISWDPVTVFESSIVEYEVLYSATLFGEYFKIATTSDTSYIDTSKTDPDVISYY